MNEPLALLLTNRGLIASQLKERLEALRYRFVVVAEPEELVDGAVRERAMVVLADLEGREEAVVSAVGQLRATPATAHIPAIGFRKELTESFQNELLGRGFAVMVNESALLSHLSQLLDRALDVH